MNQKSVAIVTTIYKSELNSEEQTSIRQANHFFKPYDRFALVPADSNFKIESFTSIEFPAKYFVSAKANADLLFSEELYKKFINYKQILLYEIDCLVFSDQMEYWLEKNYDYIGAPWIKKFMVKRYDYPDAVGNGGFALRKTDAFLKALEAQKHPWKCIWRDIKKAFMEKKIKRLIPHLFDLWKNTRGRTKLIEDRWWSFKAKNYYPEFNVAPVEEGIKFAWEIAPREMLKLNNGKLPFGAHAWARYDKEFWKPYLLPPQ